MPGSKTNGIKQVEPEKPAKNRQRGIFVNSLQATKHFSSLTFPYLLNANFRSAALVSYPNGAIVPAEPLDVAAARSEHLKAHSYS